MSSNEAAQDTSRALLRSSHAAVLSQVWRMGVVFATHMLLRRLVDPGPWGVWHWSEPIFLLIGQLRDLGMPGHVVRLDEPRPYRAFFRLQMVGIVLTGGMVLLAAPWMARGFKEADSAEVTAVVRVLVLFLLFEGLAKIPLTYFEAELRIEESLVPELLRNATFAAVSLVLAIQFRGVWCFVVGHVAGSAVLALALWVRAWPGLGPALRRRVSSLPWFDEAKELLRLSLPLVVMSILVLLLGRIDPLVLGLRFEPTVVGHYGMALFLAFLLSILVALPVSRALYPALQRLKGDPVRFFEAYRLATIVILALEVPYAFSLFLNSEVLLGIFGGAEYPGAATIYLQVLCFAPLLQPFSRCAGDVLLIRHHDGVLIVSSILSLVSLAGVGYVLCGFLGPVAMAWVNLLPFGTLVVAWAVWRIDPPAFRGLGKDLALIYTLPVPVFWAVRELTPAESYLRLGASFLATGIVLAAFALRYRRDFVRFFRRQDGSSQDGSSQDG